VLLGVALVLGILFQIASGTLVERFMALEPVASLDHPLSSIGRSDDDDIMQRGYIRLIQNPRYLAFGAGEGEFERLTQIADEQSKEFHSTLGTILMSYGLVGLAFVRAAAVRDLRPGPARQHHLSRPGDALRHHPRGRPLLGILGVPRARLRPGPLRRLGCAPTTALSDGRRR
jgi:hypothetical protein